MKIGKKHIKKPYRSLLVNKWQFWWSASIMFWTITKMINVLTHKCFDPYDPYAACWFPITLLRPLIPIWIVISGWKGFLLCLQVIILWSCVQFVPLSYGAYPLPGWAQCLGWGMAGVNILIILLVAGVKVTRVLVDTGMDKPQLKEVSAWTFDTDNNEPMIKHVSE